MTKIAVINLKAKKMPKLNAVLVKLMDRGEQPIQKIRTNIEYKQVEARVRQRILKSRIKRHICTA